MNQVKTDKDFPHLAKAANAAEMAALIWTIAGPYSELQVR